MPEELRAEVPALSRLEESYQTDARFDAGLDLPFEPPLVVAPVESPSAPPSSPNHPERRRDSSGRYQASPSPDTPAEDQAPRAFAHSALVESMAKDLGYSQDDLDTTPPRVMELRVKDVYRLQQQLLAERRQSQPALQAQPVPAQPQQAFDLDRYLQEQGYSEDDPLAKLARHQQAQIQSIRGEIERDRAVQKDQSREQFLDGAFAKINDPRLGNSEPGKKIMGSEAMSRRRAVLREAESLTGGSEESKILLAYERLFGKAEPAGAYDESAEPKSNGHAPVNRISQLERRRQVWDEEGPVAVPSHRKPAPLKPDDRAALKVQQLQRDFDYSPSALGLADDDTP